MRGNNLNRNFVGMNCSPSKVSSVSCENVVMISHKYIDVLAAGATISRCLPNP